MTAPPRPFVIPSLDGMRGIAFLLVFVNHAGWHPFEGRVCLQMFFVLSGYLITTLLRREWERTGTFSLRAYYLRRVLRIFPPMYLVLALLLVLSLTHVLKDSFTWGGFSATTFHLTNYWIAYGHTDDLIRGVTPWWSLAVEEHFYLLSPLVFLVLFRTRSSVRRKGFVLAAVALAIFAYRSWISFTLPVPAAYFRAYFPTEVAADAILWGCVLALVANPALDVIRGSRRLWTGLVLPLALVVIWASQAGPRLLNQSVGYTVQSLAFMAIFIAIVKFPDTLAGRFLNWRPVAFLGVMSYSMYLLHYAFIAMGKDYVPGPRIVQVGVALVATLIGGYIVYVGVEKPCARLRRRWSRAGEAETFADRTSNPAAVPTN